VKPDAEFSCPTCAGAGCEACDGTGKFMLTTCPHEFVGSDIPRMMRFAKFARDGSWPVAGGTLDQSEWFADFCRLLWSEQDIYEAMAKAKGMA